MILFESSVSGPVGKKEKKKAISRKKKLYQTCSIEREEGFTIF